MFREGRYVATPLMAAHFLKTVEPGCRIGFAAGRKSGTAVVRNRLKRRLREALRATGLTVLPEGYDIVILARTPMLEASLPRTSDALRNLLLRIAG